MTNPSPDWIADAVYAQLLKLAPREVNPAGVDASSRLIEDLGLDSMKFVDLTVGLEEALGIPEFPMQDWVDALVARDEPLRAGALIAACEALVGVGAAESR
ncbi:MAG TPA: acyl carrier protein [Polyangiales bacterium]|nr:acyl carrier protein [Polyangiales bacterium]